MARPAQVQADCSSEGCSVVQFASVNQSISDGAGQSDTPDDQIQQGPMSNCDAARQSWPHIRLFPLRPAVRRGTTRTGIGASAVGGCMLLSCMSGARKVAQGSLSPVALKTRGVGGATKPRQARQPYPVSEKPAEWRRIRDICSYE